LTIQFNLSFIHNINTCRRSTKRLRRLGKWLEGLQASQPFKGTHRKAIQGLWFL